ncbi:Hypothetical protein HVR_LOCUS1107 [uncultured virus]|nr:Hypothetical protein HVR_LOCUS1107 [uncultured virus]
MANLLRRGLKDKQIIDGAKAHISDDITNRYALFITGDPFFEINPVIRYKLDFSNETSFLQSIRSISVSSKISSCSHHYLYKIYFDRNATAIVYILDQLTRDNRYDRLKLSAQKTIILRDGNANCVVLENTSNSQNQILLFDLGTIQRIIDEGIPI